MRTRGSVLASTGAFCRRARSASVGIVLAALFVPTPARAWDNLLVDPGFERYHYDEEAGYYVPDADAAWTEFGFGRASVRFDASSWTAPPEMLMERPLGFTPATTGYEGMGETENTGRMIWQQDVVDPWLEGGHLYEAWVWLGGAGLDDNTDADNKDETGGWEIYFFNSRDPSSWTESEAIEHHKVLRDYWGEPDSFVRLSGIGRIPNGTLGLRFCAWGSIWYSAAGPGDYNTQVAVDNAHFAVIRAGNLLANGNFEQDTTSAEFRYWDRPAAWPFPKNGQDPVLDLRNTYGSNIDDEGFRPYWGGSHAYGYETWIYDAWIDDAFTFSQVAPYYYSAGTPLTFTYYWMQNTRTSGDRYQMRDHGGEIGTVIEYLDANSQRIAYEEMTENWPVASNPANTCKYDQNAGVPYNPRYRLVPPAGTESIRVNVNVMTHLLYSLELSHVAHLVDDFSLFLAQGTDEVSDVYAEPDLTTAMIYWTSNNPLGSTVDYGITTAYGNTVTDPAPTSGHQVQLTDLVPEQKYYYRVTSGAASYPTPGNADTVYFTTRYYHGDFDHDGDLDQEDYGFFQACYSGNGNTQPLPECEPALFDDDDDVDENDFDILLGCMGGPNVPIVPDCGA